MVAPLLRDCGVFWKSLVLILTPIACLPLLFINGGGTEAKCAYATIIMAVYWMTEVVPLAVTSFLPIFLFPLLGVLPVKETCANYLKDTNFLFVGGLIVAAAVEECNLHKRLALRVLLLLGSQPRWLMLGFMIVTAFLSMWISNTATTAMMVPIAIAVLDELTRFENDTSSTVDDLDGTVKVDLHAVHSSVFIGQAAGEDVAVQAPPLANEAPPDGQLNFNHMTQRQRGVCKGILLCVCYAANIGGTGTLTGTGPNLVFRGQLDSTFPGVDTGVSFASWMLFAIPPMLICLLVAWLWLQLRFFGVGSFFDCFRRSPNRGPKANERVNAMLRRKYDELGGISFAEGSTAAWFLILVVLWIFRQPRFIPGWAGWFEKGYVSDAVPAMFVACVLFAWPNKLPDYSCCRPDESRRAVSRRALLTWSVMQKRFPWGVIMLLGGGFALANGVKASGLSHWLGCSLQTALGSLSPFAIVAIFTTIITFITEVSSNTATASIFVPIMLAVAQNLHIHPLYMALPATIAPSFAFMLPVATPPNAIVYDTAAVRIPDMMVAGFVMNWLCIAVTLLNINTYAYVLFDLSKYPAWAAAASVGATCGNALIANSTMSPTTITQMM